MPDLDKKAFSFTDDLSEEDQKDFEYVKKRIFELQESREKHYGVNLDRLWNDADKDYIPHRLGTKGRKVFVSDEDKGWRSTLVSLGANEWQSDISQPNPFIKIQAALSILIDQNPSGVFTPTSKKYQATTELMRQLYQRSWEYARSKEQLKLFVYNLSKYGWAIARTYPLRIARKVKVLKEYDQENPEKSTYDKKEIVEFNDIFRENLDPRNAWIDDTAKPNNPFSIRDWCWRKVYAFDAAEEEFGKYPLWKKFVKPGGITTEVISSYGRQASTKNIKEKNLVEVYFYENRIKDLYIVIANGVPVIIAPLPISDAKGLKKLSCWQAYWNIRHAESPYGIGIYEAIKNDQNLVDRIRNMTIDQLTLSIYKMFFYTGTQSLTDTGDIKITPGVGKQVLDSKNISWLQVPGPGAEAWKGLEVFKEDLNEASAIGDPLTGVVTGKTAFETAQAKEAALKRLKTPLENILDALDQEGYISVSLIQILYSIPETYKITDQRLIEDYLKEIQGNPELYERDESGNFIAKVFPEFPLNLDTDEKGTLIGTPDTRFFRVIPSHLQWEGMINIKSQSILTPSKQIDKALELEMYNMLIPLLGQPPQVYSKIAKNIVKLYDKDPRDILPDEWTQEVQQVQQPKEQPLLVPTESLQQPEQLGQPAEKLVSSTKIPERPQNIAQRIISRFTGAARKI